MNYRGQSHKEMFNLAIKNRKTSSFRYLSAVYLLTADKKLWSRSKKAVTANSVDFSKINSAKLEPQSYTLLTAATRTMDTIKRAVFGTRYVLANQRGEGFVDSGVKILIAVVIGALLLAGLYLLFSGTILPTLTEKIKGLFNYSS